MIDKNYVTWYTNIHIYVLKWNSRSKERNVLKSMAYSKLTPSLVDAFIKAFEVVATGDMIGQSAVSVRKPSIRAVCEIVGVSHNTFYRWLRAYRALVAIGKKGQEQENLIAFGEAVETMYANYEEQEYIASVDTSPACPMRSVEDLEKLTDQLTASFSIVEFDTPNFAKRRVNQK